MGNKRLEYMPNGRELEVMLNLLQSHGSVVLPATWNLDGIVEKLRDIAPPEVYVMGRKQPYLGEAIGVSYPIIHMQVNLDHNGIVVEPVEKAQKDTGIQIERETFISSVTVPIAHADLFDVVTLLSLGHIRYATRSRTATSTTIEFGCPEEHKVYWIETMDRHLRNAAKKQAEIEAANTTVEDVPAVGDEK